MGKWLGVKRLFVQIIYANHFVKISQKNYVVAAELSGQSMIQTDIDVLQGLLKHGWTIFAESFEPDT